MQNLLVILAALSQAPQNTEQSTAPQPPPPATAAATTPQPSTATPATTAVAETLGPDKEVFINQRGYVCVARQVLTGAPECVGKWRVRYRVAKTTYAASYSSASGTFLNWLNSTRASFGLPAVGEDPGLSQWAAVNNAQQAARGMGHHVMGTARRQNAAAGGDVNTVGPMWMASPAHRAALLDPTIRMIGIAGLGAYWTFNAS